MTIGTATKKQKALQAMSQQSGQTAAVAVARGQIPPAESSFSPPFNPISDFSVLGKRRREANVIGHHFLEDFRHALENNNIELATKIALSSKRLLDERAENGCSALHYAASWGAAAVLQILVDMSVKNGENIDDNYCNKNEQTPLYYACISGSTDCVEILLKAGADWNSESRTGSTPFCMAIERRHFDIVKKIAVWALEQKCPIQMESCLSSIAQYSPDERLKLQQVIPFEELNAIKAAGHAWGLEGCVQIGPLSEEYEGSFTKLMEPYVYDFFKEYLEKLEPQHKLKGLLKEIGGIAESGGLDPIALAKSIEGGKIGVIPVIAEEHIQYLVVSNSNLYQCDRGGPSDENMDLQFVPGVISYKIGAKENIVEFLKKIEKYKEQNEVGIESFVYLSSRREYKFKIQSRGNCECANLKVALFAVMMEYGVSLGMKTEEAAALAKTCYKDFSRFHRIRMIENLLSGPAPQSKVLQDVLDKLEDDERMQGIFQGHEQERQKLAERIRDVLDKQENNQSSAENETALLTIS